MAKKNYMLLLSLLSIISSVEISDKDLPLNSLRKLQSSSSETILLGYDNYNFTYDSSTKQSNFKFFMHFLLKNWNYTSTEINNDNNVKFNNISLRGFISYQSNNEINEANFNCSKKPPIEEIDSSFYYLISGDNQYRYLYHYYHAIFECEYNLTDRGIPKKINITTNFTNNVFLNDSQVSFVSSSVEALERDLVSLKYDNNFDDMEFLYNATFVRQSPNSFQIKGEELDNDYVSENIQLITNVNGVPKKIPCSGKKQKDSSDDKTYYFVESKGSNNLAGADLRHAILNYTKQDRIVVLNFKEETKESNGTIFPPKVDYKKKSGGLSTGGIIAIVIPAVLVLLGIGALAFFLSRRAVPSPPIKNIGNNTMGVVASSEAVVHQ